MSADRSHSDFLAIGYNTGVNMLALPHCNGTSLSHGILRQCTSVEVIMLGRGPRGLILRRGVSVHVRFWALIRLGM